MYPQGGARTVHLSTNLVIDVDEAAGTAVSRSVYVMLQQTDELPLQVIDAGRNTDTFTKVGGACRSGRSVTSTSSGTVT